MTETITQPTTDRRPEQSLVAPLLSRISRLEVIAAAVAAIVLLVLVVIEPDILEAPFENARSLLFTVGGTVLAGLVFVAMLWGRVPPIVRLIVLGIPFILVNWWLLSPYFVDEVVDEQFSVSIASQLESAAPAAAASVPTSTGTTGDATTAAPAAPADDAAADEAATYATAPAAADDEAMVEEGTAEVAEADTALTGESAAPAAPEATPVPTPSGPVLIGAGQFVGLAGHDGTGDTGLFRNSDGSLLLRFENFDIDNGPDLEVYLVPGADQVSLADGSIHLGALKGNVGDQNYELPDGATLAPGPYTVLVWCEAFSVEFVGATINV